MVSNLAQYVARSPRYILQPHDNTLIRVAGPHQVPWEEGTFIHNVSLSGLAFTAPTDLCPMIGETIRIQFDTQSQGQMACLALVIRLQKATNSSMLVAVKFSKMDVAQRLLLAQALTEKLKDQADEIDGAQKKRIWKNARTRLFLGMAFITLWMILMQFVWKMIV